VDDYFSGSEKEFGPPLMTREHMEYCPGFHFLKAGVFHQCYEFQEHKSLMEVNTTQRSPGDGLARKTSIHEDWEDLGAIVDILLLSYIY
jgi:hypothetical protein